MSRFGTLTHLLPELVRTLFVGRVTVHFPFKQVTLPAQFRGKVVMRPALCRGCGLCVRDCPAFALELEREGKNQFRLIHYRDRCAYCGQCEDTCNQEAILLISEIVPATSRRDTLAQVIVERKAESKQR